MRHRNKTKIAIFIPNLQGGGAERICVTLANELAKNKNYDVSLLVLEKTGSYWDQLSKKINVVSFNKGRMRFAVLPLARYLFSNKPDVLMMNLHYTVVWGALAKVMSFSTSRVIAVYHRDLASEKLPVVQKAALKLFQPFIQLNIGVSEGVSNSVAALLGTQKKIKTIYNPIITADLYKNASRHVSHRWFKAKHPPVIIAVGRFHPQKNFPLLLEAFAEVRLRYSKARLLILGDGAERPKLEALVKKLGLSGSVEMPGFVANPYAYMRRAKLFVLSSDYEGLPTVLVEALACGCPVVATNCPSGPDEILQGGKYGQLVTPGNKEELCAAICYVLENYAKEKKKVQQFQKKKLPDFFASTTVSQYWGAIRR